MSEAEIEPEDHDNGRCPNCGEDEMDGGRCYYCGYCTYDTEEDGSPK